MAERLDSVPESYCSDDDLQDDLDYYYNDGSEDEERGEEELNELAANVDPEYYEFKCLRKGADVLSYLDTLADKLVEALRGKGVVSIAGRVDQVQLRGPATASACGGCGLFTLTAEGWFV